MQVFRLFVILFSLGQMGDAKAQPQPWRESKTKGWLWYKREPKRQDPEKKDTLPSTKSQFASETKAKPVTYRDLLKKEKEEFEEIEARAVVNPTLSNVRAYHQAHNRIMNQADDFSRKWMVASLLNADTYEEASQPYPAHRKIYQEKADKKLDQQIKACAGTYGLFFIYKKECPYCHQFAPIVREFIDTYGFDYKAISPDGAPLSEFPDAVADNGTIQIINPDGIYPALFLVNPQTRDVIPLSRGLVNQQELRGNMKLIIEYLERNSHD